MQNHYAGVTDIVENYGFLFRMDTTEQPRKIQHIGLGYCGMKQLGYRRFVQGKKEKESMV
jgi:hypothetical protein